MKKLNMKKNKIYPAFTTLELVFVIVVLGILAAIAIPRLEQDLRQEAADHILSNIRYTQHMALNDHKQKADDPQWQRRFWSIAFAKCADGTHFYRIGSDTNDAGGTYSGDSGVFSQNEAATDPYNRKALWAANNGNCDATGISENIKIGDKYGVTVGNGTGGCTGKHIGFDHLGRPHTSFGASDSPDYDSYMLQDCVFTFNMPNDDPFQIRIDRETGYAHIVGQDDS